MHRYCRARRPQSVQQRAIRTGLTFRARVRPSVQYVLRLSPSEEQPNLTILRVLFVSQPLVPSQRSIQHLVSLEIRLAPPCPGQYRAERRVRILLPQYGMEHGPAIRVSVRS